MGSVLTPIGANLQSRICVPENLTLILILLDEVRPQPLHFVNIGGSNPNLECCLYFSNCKSDGFSRQEAPHILNVLKALSYGRVTRTLKNFYCKIGCSTS